MIFLGQAANYRFGTALKHLFAHGNNRQSLALRQALAKRYRASVPKPQQGSNDEPVKVPLPEDRVALYHTGRSALCAAIEATTPKGSAVIITGLTCIAVVRAVCRAGCIPVFADINRADFQFDQDTIKKALDKCKHMRYNAHTIVVQNTLGRPLEMSRIEEIAQKNHLIIIEDLAHCAGRFYPDGREVGTVGVATALSFGKGKAIDTIEGGALVLRDTQYQMPNPPVFRPKRADRWRDRWYPVLGWMIRGAYHLRFGKILTAVFLKLHWVAKSADAELNLDVMLTNWQAKLALQQLTQLPKTPLREGMLVRDRRKLLQELRSHGYFLDEIWYDVPVSPARYLKEADFSADECPETAQIAQQMLNLPTYYPAEKLEPVRALIKPYLIEEEDV